jgi:hypothetical protein
MKVGISCCAFLAIMLAACAPTKQSPLYLTILKPRDGDTVKTLIDSVVGKTYPQARVSVGFAQNSPNNVTLVPDDTGLFSGMYTIPEDETDSFSVFISASFGGSTITETRLVHYIHLQ